MRTSPAYPASAAPLPPRVVRSLRDSPACGVSYRPLSIRSALAYVLFNGHKHGDGRVGLEPCCSAYWSAAAHAAPAYAAFGALSVARDLPVAAAPTWRLRLDPTHRAAVRSPQHVDQLDFEPALHPWPRNRPDASSSAVRRGARAWSTGCGFAAAAHPADGKNVSRSEQRAGPDCDNQRQLRPIKSRRGGPHTPPRGAIRSTGIRPRRNVASASIHNDAGARSHAPAHPPCATHRRRAAPLRCRHHELRPFKSNHSKTAAGPSHAQPNAPPTT